MKRYIFICDIDYGIEEFYSEVIEANSIKQAIEEFKSIHDLEHEEPSDLTTADLSETIDEIIEITPDGTITKWNSYAYFMSTHDEEEPLKYNMIQAILDGINIHF